MGGGVFIQPASFNTDVEFVDITGLVDYSRPRMLTFTFHTMQSGDLIGHIAARAGLNEDTLISVNNIRNTRLMQIGQVIKIPNQDGINYTVRPGDTIESIAVAHNTTASHIRTANELFSDTLAPNSSIFVPGGRMDWVNRQEVNGDLFIWPTVGRISSPFGFRRSPFTGARQFHGGIDIAAPLGTPIRAAMAGRIARVGYNNILGNYIIINHHSNFRTVYAHLHVVRVRTGDNVATGERIGDVGSTGLSTGPHLHFEVHRNGVRVNPRTLMR
jgi:murein DD-endopeptidase MepM/ murein hydrolase activator NlpD